MNRPTEQTPLADSNRDSSVDHQDPLQGSWESLLQDALASPPIPDSLARRLDSGVEQLWGHSPELVPDSTGNLGRVLTSGLQRVKRWPIAVCLAACVMVAFVIASSSNTYAWAAMLEAISQRGGFQVAATNGAGHIETVSLATTPLKQRTQRFLAAILSDHGVVREDGWLDGVKLIDESWSERNSTVRLNAEFETSDQENLHLQCEIHPETKLPVSVIVRSKGSPPVSFALSFDLPAGANSAMLAHVGGDADRLTNDIESSEASSSHPSELDAELAEMPVTEEPIPRATSVESNVLANDHAPANVQVAYATQVPQWGSVPVVSQTPDQIVSKINASLQTLWTASGVQPAEPASDQEMLRRVYLDLAGRTPTVNEVRQFLGDEEPQRYERLVDRLLASSDHDSHLATTWRMMLIPEGVDVSRLGGLSAFDQWLAAQFQAEKPYDEIVRELLLAQGRLSKSGPLLFYSALKLEAEKLASKTSRVFLGIRLECAQCHDHPFEPWTQEDFWSYAAFFAQISRPRGDLQSVSTVMQVRDVDRGEVMLPETETVVQPRLLGIPLDSSLSDGDSENVGVATQTGRRHQLAKWLTSPENPYFARATANRLWSLLFGRGIVDPVDDFGSQNQPVTPEVLEALASQLIDNDFDLQTVLRTIALSDAYRLSSASESEVPKRLEVFSQMQVKTLTAAQLFDCIAVATLMEEPDASGAMNGGFTRFGNAARDQFLQQFASPPSNRVDYLSGIPQALTLMNGPLIHSATGDRTSGVLQTLDAPFFTDDQRIEVLFMATLSRPPRTDELAMLREMIVENGDQKRQALSDLLWALVNSAEFALNH